MTAHPAARPIGRGDGPGQAGARPEGALLTIGGRVVARPADPGPVGQAAGGADASIAAGTVLDRIPPDELAAALADGHVRVSEVWRDRMVVDRDQLEAEGEWIYLVQEGQVIAGLFDPDLLTDEREWSAALDDGAHRRKIRPQGPLIHLAEQHLALFGPGDLFNSRALAVDRDRYAFFASRPTRLVAARPEWLGAAAARHPALERALAAAVGAARAVLAALPGAGAEVLDFVVRQGLSVASTLRVVQVDRCIECGECERACRDRHGVSRLTIPGPRLGQLGFAVTCRTCIDQRCLGVCNFDSIEFDGAAGEVVIRESSCTGCASCATACPYGAIRMIPLADPAHAGYRARLAASGALAAGGDAPRGESIDQIASKCDHCAGHGDQACITQCPTGALLEVAPAALVPLLSGRAAGGPAPARMAAPFEDGLAPRVRRAGTRARRAAVAALWAVTVAGLVAAGGEIALRWFAPERSLQYAELLAQGLDPALARFNVSYLAGSGLSRWLGYAGTALLVLSLVHPLRKRVRLLRRLGSGSICFDLHVLGGTLGPLYVLLHSAFHVYNWVAIALWSFAAVTLSGAVGRYLLTRLVNRFPGHGTEAGGHEREMTRVGSAWPGALGAARAELGRYRRVARPPGPVGLISALGWIMADDLRRPLAWLRLRVRLARAPRRVRRRLAHHLGRAMSLERRAALTARSAPFLRVWLPVHLLFTAVAVVVSIAHIVAALSFSM